LKISLKGAKPRRKELNHKDTKDTKNTKNPFFFVYFVPFVVQFPVFFAP
jgi:hypothetical protein